MNSSPDTRILRPDPRRRIEPMVFTSIADLLVAEAYIAQLNAAKVFAAPIATTIEDGAIFYAAETYHQNYAARNPHQPYVAAVAAPKVEKLLKYCPDRLKP